MLFFAPVFTVNGSSKQLFSKTEALPQSAKCAELLILKPAISNNFLCILYFKKYFNICVHLFLHLSVSTQPQIAEFIAEIFLSEALKVTAVS